MAKILTSYGLLAGLFLNLFSAPISILIYEVNQKVQTFEPNQFQEISLTICETSCEIRNRIVIEQHYESVPQKPLRVNFNPLGFYFQTLTIDQISVPQKSQVFLQASDKGKPESIAFSIFVPPKAVLS